MSESGGSRQARHTKKLTTEIVNYEPATKEFFQPCSYGSPANAQAIGGHHGYLVDTDNDYAYTQVYVPRDFHSVVDATVVLIAQAPGQPLPTTMFMRIMIDHGQEGEFYYAHNYTHNNAAVRVSHNRIYEISFLNLVKSGPIVPSDHIGVQVSRQAGNNTNAIILGVRFKYT